MKKFFKISLLALSIMLISGCSSDKQEEINNLNMNQKIDNLESTINNFSSEIETLKTRNKELKKENEEITKKNKSAKEELSTIKKLNEQLINQNEKLKSETMKMFIAELENENNAENNKKTQQKENNLIEYSDKELWVSFSYSETWWEVKMYKASWKNFSGNSEPLPREIRSIYMDNFFSKWEDYFWKRWNWITMNLRSSDIDETSETLIGNYRDGNPMAYRI